MIAGRKGLGKVVLHPILIVDIADRQCGCLLYTSPQRTADRSGCRAQLPHTAGDAGGHLSLIHILPQKEHPVFRAGCSFCVI